MVDRIYICKSTHHYVFLWSYDVCACERICPLVNASVNVCVWVYMCVYAHMFACIRTCDVYVIFFVNYSTLSVFSPFNFFSSILIFIVQFYFRFPLLQLAAVQCWIARLQLSSFCCFFFLLQSFTRIAHTENSALCFTWPFTQICIDYSQHFYCLNFYVAF